MFAHVLRHSDASMGHSLPTLKTLTYLCMICADPRKPKRQSDSAMQWTGYTQKGAAEQSVSCAHLLVQEGRPLVCDELVVEIVVGGHFWNKALHLG